MHESLAGQSPVFCDVAVVGAGIAGLWLGNVLRRRGFSVVLFDKDAIGGVQTMASQGMIHGGQKYTLSGAAEAAAAFIARMPERWQACFDGCGDVDLTRVSFASSSQVMWPAGGLVSAAAVMAAAAAVNARAARMKAADIPAALATVPKFKGPVFSLPEKVLDIQSLVRALAEPLSGQIYRGSLAGLLPDGQVAVTGPDGRHLALQAQLVVVVAGTGNEDALRLLNIDKKLTQRRPLRQVMVRRMDLPLYGHGIVAAGKPRVTVTAAPLHDPVTGAAAGYVWYLGGSLAEKGAEMDEDSLLRFARTEMAEIFPQVDWRTKEWATWAGDRAEPFDAAGDLPSGPHVRQWGRVLVGWPTKLTLTPALADKILHVVEKHSIKPRETLQPLQWPQASFGACPWEMASWTRLD